MIRALAWLDRNAGRVLLAVLALVLLAGCGDPPRPINPAAPAPAAEPTTAAGRLTAAQVALRQAQEDVRTAKAELDDERTAAAQARVWWFAGIMGVLALAAAGLAIFVPSIARWAIRLSLAAGAVAALAVFAAWLLPYLWWIGGGLSLVGIVGSIVYWRLDAKSRDQVLTAVDALKANGVQYKSLFREHIDGDADMAINAARKRLGLK